MVIPCYTPKVMTVLLEKMMIVVPYVQTNPFIPEVLN